MIMDTNIEEKYILYSSYIYIYLGIYISPFLFEVKTDNSQNA